MTKAAQLAAQAAGPAFSAYQSSAQSSLSSAVFTKILFQTKEFDTASAFDNTTNHRFQPLVAGYYAVTASAGHASSMETIVSIYKNGSEYRRGADVSGAWTNAIASLVYLNGSTDYVEIYAYFAAGGAPVTGTTQTNFTAFLARAA